MVVTCNYHHLFLALKIRLESRPNLELEGFEDVAPAIWNQIKLCKYFKFYLLPKPRPDLVPYRWDMYRDDRGSIYEPVRMDLYLSFVYA